MVKYLSDNRTDPRFETILSRPQPFQGEVPEVKYAPDEIDLTPAIKAIGAGVNAYYKQQGEEVEREGMAISYSAYQAQQAAQKTQKAYKEKEQGLKNTMLNDYAIAVSRQVLDPYMQDNRTMSPVAAERKLRDLREQYIKMTGGVVNASELMKVEKDSGVTFTRDLYNADLQRQNEAYKKEIEDFDKVAKANFEVLHGAGSSEGISQKFMNQEYTDIIGLYNTFDNSVQGDFNVATSSGDVMATPGSYMSYASRDSLGKIIELSLKAFKDNALMDADPEYLNAEQLLSIRQGVSELVKNRMVTINGQQLPLSAVYNDNIIDGVINIAWKKSGIEAPYTLEQKYRNDFVAYTKDKAELAQARNNLAKAEVEQNEIAAKAGLQRSLSPTGLYLLENANIISNLDTIDPEKSSALRNLIQNSMSNISLEGNLRPTVEGKAMKKIANDSRKIIGQDTAIALKSGNVIAAENALNNTPVAGHTPLSRWDVPSSYMAMDDRENTLLNDMDDPNNPNTAIKEKNTQLHRDLYLKARRESDIWDALTAEEKDEMTRSYAEDTNQIVIRNLHTLNELGLQENIVYDNLSKKFVPVNLSSDAGLEERTQLFKIADVLNSVTHTGFEDLDVGLLDNIRNRVIRDFKQDDKIVSTPSTVKFARALWGSEEPRYKEALSNLPGTIKEGMEAFGKTTTKLATEYIGEPYVDAVVDVVDFIMNPNRTLEGELKKFKAEGSSWSNLLKHIMDTEDMSEEEVNKEIEDLKEKVVEFKDKAIATAKYGRTDIGVKEMLSDLAEKAGNKILQGIDKMYQTIRLGLEHGESVGSIPTYNVGLISRIVNGDPSVSPEETDSVMKALEQATQSDKNALDMEFNLTALGDTTEDIVKKYANEFKNIAPMNLQTMDKVMRSESVSPEEAAAALKAYKQASIKDKYKLDKRYNIGMLSRNIESRLQEASKKNSKGSLLSKIVPSVEAKMYTVNVDTEDFKEMSNKELAEYIDKEIPEVSKALDFPEDLIKGKFFAESSNGTNPDIKWGKDDAVVGYMQLTKNAVKQIKEQPESKKIRDEVLEYYPNIKWDRTNPVENLIIGVAYMKDRERIIRYKLSQKGKTLPTDTIKELALFAYNAKNEEVNKAIDDAIAGKDWKEGIHKNYKIYLKNHQ